MIRFVKTNFRPNTNNKQKYCKVYLILRKFLPKSWQKISDWWFLNSLPVQRLWINNIYKYISYKWDKHTWEGDNTSRIMYWIFLENAKYTHLLIHIFLSKMLILGLPKAFKYSSWELLGMRGIFCNFNKVVPNLYVNNLS